jgi:hypothetical protein
MGHGMDPQGPAMAGTGIAVAPARTDPPRLPPCGTDPTTASSQVTVPAPPPFTAPGANW